MAFPEPEMALGTLATVWVTFGTNRAFS